MKANSRLTLPLVAFLFCTAAQQSSIPRRDAVFCQQTKLKESTFAGRTLANGQLRFVMTQWQYDKQAFLIGGTAKKIGPNWVYFSVQEGESCRMTFRWPSARRLSIGVDPRANCEGNAGYGFISKSVDFQPRHFIKPVTDELRVGLVERKDDPCDLPRRSSRRGSR